MGILPEDLTQKREREREGGNNYGVDEINSERILNKDVNIPVCLSC